MNIMVDGREILARAQFNTRTHLRQKRLDQFQIRQENFSGLQN